jgi:hypothetical protein
VCSDIRFDSFLWADVCARRNRGRPARFERKPACCRPKRSRGPILTPLAAAALALESLALAVLYARYSLALTAANPLVWVVAGALIAAFVAYGRYTLRTLA